MTHLLPQHDVPWLQVQVCDRGALLVHVLQPRHQLGGEVQELGQRHAVGEGPGNASDRVGMA